MSQTKAQLVEGKGDAVFDTDTLVVDSTNNRVGIGTSSPTDSLTVNGGIDVIDNYTINLGSNQGGGATLNYNPNGNLDIAPRSGYSTVFLSTFGGTERARIDSSGRLLVGTSSSYNNGRSGKIQVASTSDPFITATRFGSTSGGGELYLGASKGSLGAQGLVSDGFQLGLIAFTGSDGTQHREAALIKAQVDGTPGTNDMPGRLIFGTTADGSNFPTERMRITSDGTVRLSNSPGIDFSGIQTNAAGMTSETLDGYEEGSWTPVLNKAGTTGSVTGYTAQLGFYRKVGGLLWISFYLYKSSGTFGTGTNHWYVSGLPFDVASLQNGAYQAISGGYMQINGANYNFSSSVSGGGTAAGARWQANSTNGPDTLTLYGVIHNENWTSGGIEMSGFGVLML